MSLEQRLAAPVTEIEAARIAREIYGIHASADVLPGEYDDNFRLHSDDRRQYVLKVMHPARERSFVDMQCQALWTLAEAVTKLVLPRVCLSVKSELFTKISL